MKVRYYLIVDDASPDAVQLESQLTKFPFFHRADIVPTIESAIDVLSRQPIDVIFLDIKLNDQSGLTLLKTALELPPIIITSAYPEYAVESYEIGKTADYLLKPFTHERLQIALNRALHLQRTADNFVDIDAIFLKIGRKIQRFKFDAIDYVEAFGIYSKVYVGGQMYVVNERFSTLTTSLPANLFIRVHKSYIIHIGKITSYDRHNLWLQQTKIPIGISFRSRLEGLMMLFNAD